MARNAGARVTPARRFLIAAAFLAALGLRVALLARFRGNFDVGSFAQVAEIVRHGGDLYGETPRYNYAPAWAAVVAAAASIARAANLSLSTVLGGLLLVTDVATAWVLYVLAGRGHRGAAAALLFFANPVSVIVTGHYLQFDNVAILFLLLAMLAARRLPEGRASAVAALSASLLVKHVTAFFPLLFAGGTGRRGLGRFAAALPYAVFAASFLPFWKSWPAIRANVVAYRGGTEAYGVGLLRAVPAVPSWLPMALFLAAVAAAILIGRKLELARAGLLLFIVMLLFTPGINEYYLVWPIALGSLFGGAGYAVYTLVTAGFLIGGSLEGLGVENAHLPGWHGVWWSLVFWSLWDARRRSILSRQ
jgi:hypothetical protein